MTYSAPHDLAVGHVHLKVSNLDRSVAFYRDVLGLEVQNVLHGRAAFLSAGGYHHHVALNTWHSLGAGRAPQRAPGLFHSAFVYPDRASLASALANVIAHGVKIDGAADHGVSEAIYFEDPDGNGIEIYRDRPRAEWPRDADGKLALDSGPLDLDALLAEALQPAG